MARSVLIMVLLFGIACLAQSTQSLPDEAFISADKYTNAFFGFALPLPQIGNVQPFLPNAKDSGQVLFGFQSYGRGLAVFLITANQSQTGSSEDAKKAAAGLGNHAVKQVMIGGKAFWKGESEQKGPGGKLKNVLYATALKGYIVRLTIMSFDAQFATTLERMVEGLTFFDPASARDVAGPNARPYVARGIPPAQFVPSKRLGKLARGVVTGHLYTNDDLGFSYEFPEGWQAVDQAMQDKVIEAGHQAAWGNDPAAEREHEQAAQFQRLLLYATKYPLGTKPGTDNPAVMILVFDPDSLPGAPPFPTSVDDNAGISRIASVLVQSLLAGGLKPTKQDSVRVLTAQNHLMIEIPGEYSAGLPGESLSIRGSASVVFMELQRYWVALIFVSATETGIRELMAQAKFRFTPAAALPPGTP